MGLRSLSYRSTTNTRAIPSLGFICYRTMTTYGNQRNLSATCLIMSRSTINNLIFRYLRLLLKRMFLTIMIMCQITERSRNTCLMFKRTRHSKRRLTQSSIFTMLQIRTARHLRISVARDYCLIRIRRTIRRGNINDCERLKLRKASTVLNVMNRSMNNYCRNERMTTHLAKRMMMSIPGVNLSTQTMSNLIRIAQTTIMNYCNRTPIARTIMRITRVLNYYPNNLRKITTIVSRTVLLRPMRLTYTMRGLPGTNDSDTECNSKIRNQFSCQRMFRFIKRTVRVGYLLCSELMMLRRARRMQRLVTRLHNMTIGTTTRKLVMCRLRRTKRINRSLNMCHITRYKINNYYHTYNICRRMNLHVPAIR